MKRWLNSSIHGQNSLLLRVNYANNTDVALFDLVISDMLLHLQHSNVPKSATQEASEFWWINQQIERGKDASLLLMSLLGTPFSQ